MSTEVAGVDPGPVTDDAILPTLRQIERRAILDRLEAFGGRKPEAAASLGICVKTLYNKLLAYRVRDDLGLPRSAGRKVYP